MVPDRRRHSAGRPSPFPLPKYAHPFAIRIRPLLPPPPNVRNTNIGLGITGADWCKSLQITTSPFFRPSRI